MRYNSIKKQDVAMEALNLQLAFLKSSGDCQTQSSMPNVQFDNYDKMLCLLLCVFQTQFVEHSDYKSEPIIDAEYRKKSRLY
jgi:hypothetical protein